MQFIQQLESTTNALLQRFMRLQQETIQLRKQHTVLLQERDELHSKLELARQKVTHIIAQTQHCEKET